MPTLVAALRARLPRQAVTAACLLLAAVLLLPGIRNPMEHRLQALLLAGAGWSDQSPATPITVVAIDEASIDTLGPWPWPREVWAELLDRLRAHHRPTVIGLDVVFPPDPRQDSGNLEFSRSLAAQLSVLGQLLISEPGVRGLPRWTTVLTDATGNAVPATLDPESYQRDRMPGILGSEPVLVRIPAVDVGHINARIDPDGVMRRVPGVLCADFSLDTCSPSFVQAIIQQLTGVTYWEVRRGSWTGPAWELIPGDFSTLALPADTNLQLIIPWRHPSGLRRVSAADIWESRLPPGLLDQEIVLFGGVSIGLGDIATSPLGQTVPGVEVHAQVLREWLQRALPFEPRYGAPLAWAWIVLTALALAFTANRLWWLLAVVATTTLLPLIWAAVAWSTRSALVPAAGPAAFALAAGALLLVRCVLVQHQRVAQRAVGYLPYPLRRLLQQPQHQVPRETGWGTILVADILGYTRQSRSLPLDKLAQWCDLGMDHVVHHATAHGAMLDNVAGDGALLIWREGTPEQQARAALDSVRAILSTLPALNEKLHALGLPPIAIGFGLHAGPYLLGTFGSGQKRYTVVSEAANLAAHIERQTRYYPWPVLVSETVARLVPSLTTNQVATLPAPDGSSMGLHTLADEPDNLWPKGLVAKTASTST